MGGNSELHLKRKFLGPPKKLCWWEVGGALALRSYGPEEYAPKVSFSRVLMTSRVPASGTGFVASLWRKVLNIEPSRDSMYSCAERETSEGETKELSGLVQ